MRRSYVEDSVQKAIVYYLRLNGFLCTSQSAGLIKDMRTQITANRLGYLKGSPDIIVWINGGTLNIECKAPNVLGVSEKTGKMIKKKAEGKQSQSQKDFEESINQIKGHHYIVAKDPLDVANYIKENDIRPV